MTASFDPTSSAAIQNNNLHFNKSLVYFNQNPHLYNTPYYVYNMAPTDQDKHPDLYHKHQLCSVPL